MPSWLKPETPAEMPSELLSLLRKHDNPFDDFVQARRAGGSFRRRHVAAVNRSVLEKLQAMIDRYCLDVEPRDVQSLTIDDIPRCGVLLVLGPRGAGKTHLVHALQTREGPGLVIAPAHYEPHRPFAEYLLQVFIRALEDDAPPAGPQALRTVADWLARQTAVQAIYGMTDLQWAASQTARDGIYWRRLLGFGGRALADRRELLIKSLLDPGIRNIGDVCRFRELRSDELRDIALRQVETSETSRSIGGQIRRGLYLHLVHLAFGRPSHALFEFLCDGFTQIEATLPPSRETLVEELLSALTELFLLAECPVVFAFDALEALLSDPPDEKRCHAFFRGLAEVLGSQRGLPLVLFAEAGHWEQAQRYLSSYAAQRLQQGVPTRGFGSLRQLSLPPVSVDDLEKLVAARLSGLLESNGRRAPANLLGPFQREDLAQIARSGADAPPLRQMLQALRDLYQERVFGDGAAGAFVPADVPAGQSGAAAAEVQLMDLWTREHKAALRRLDSEGIAVQSGSLHSGLARWLEHLAALGSQAGAWKLFGCELTTFGNHPSFGQLVRCRWSSGDEEREQAIGFLLGQGANMPRDLKEKLRMMASARPAVRSLAILWPRVMECAGPAEKHLPPGTRKVWEDFGAPSLARQVALRAMEPSLVAAWIAVESWEAAVREEGPVRMEVLQRFLAERTGDLLPLLAPIELAPLPEEPDDELAVASR
jgi:hypothetical protein